MSCIDMIVGLAGLIWVLAFPMYCWISIYTCSWMEDFTDWGDNLTDMTSEVDCSYSSKLTKLADNTDTFSTISWIFAFVSVYYVLSICCAKFVETFSGGKVVGCNFIIFNASIMAYIVEYFIILDLLNTIKDETDACGLRYESTIDDADSYYDKLTEFPIVLTLPLYIYQFIVICYAMYIVIKGEKSGAGDARDRGYSQLGASADNFITAFAGGIGGIGAPGRPRTESEEQRAVVVSALTVMMYGFEFATEANCTNAMRKLDATECGRQTALRDAIALGFNRMIKLKDHLTKINSFDHNFIHIVLTDGQDNKSQIDKIRFLALQHVLNEAQFHTICKTIFVGVGLDYQAEQDLRAYSVLGGQSATFQNCNEMDIESVFDHISINLIQRTRMAALQTQQGTLIMGQRERAIEFGFNHFLVLFTLDISGSMGGYRWKAVKRAVRSLLNNLKSSDIFGIVLFNDETKVITGK